MKIIEYEDKYLEDIKVQDLKIDNSSYIVFCWNKKDYYHMIPIIDNVIYDKNFDCMNLYVISIYTFPTFFSIYYIYYTFCYYIKK